MLSPKPTLEAPLTGHYFLPGRYSGGFFQYRLRRFGLGGLGGVRSSCSMTMSPRSSKIRNVLIVSDSRMIVNGWSSGRRQLRLPFELWESSITTDRPRSSTTYSW